MSGRGLSEAGFTMIELLMAMAVFSFMLMLIVIGVLNVARFHNMAVASNNAQDNARAAMETLVRAVRDSQGVASLTSGPSGTLCLNDASGTQKYFWIKAVAGNKTLYRGDNCPATPGTEQAITNQAVQVSAFSPVLQTSGPNVVKPEVQLSVTVASNNGTTNGAGTACNNNNADREFCSVVTLTSGAVPR